MRVGLSIVGLMLLVTAAQARESLSTSDSKLEGKTVLGIAGTRFTLNGNATFLLGFSYYGGLGATTDRVVRDLDHFQRHGFNWLRVWATWEAYGEDVSAFDAEGYSRQACLDRLRWLVAECDRRGMVVDVTLARGKAVSDSAGRLGRFEAHRRAVETLVDLVKRHRNWYLDLANERDVRDDRYVAPAELKSLRELVRQLDRHRLVTASFGGHDLEEKDIRETLVTIGADFLAPHRPRTPNSPRETESRTRASLEMMQKLGRVAPILLQEPFRRGYTQWDPVTGDFLADLRGAVVAGAAGWCFHNGSQRGAPEERPRRSFDLRSQGLLDQLDAQEVAVMEAAGGIVANP